MDDYVMWRDSWRTTSGQARSRGNVDADGAEKRKQEEKWKRGSPPFALETWAQDVHGTWFQISGPLPSRRGIQWGTTPAPKTSLRQEEEVTSQYQKPMEVGVDGQPAGTSDSQRGYYNTQHSQEEWWQNYWGEWQWWSRLSTTTTTLDREDDSSFLQLGGSSSSSSRPTARGSDVLASAAGAEAAPPKGVWKPHVTNIVNAVMKEGKVHLNIVLETLQVLEQELLETELVEAQNHESENEANLGREANPVTPK